MKIERSCPTCSHLKCTEEPLVSFLCQAKPSRKLTVSGGVFSIGEHLVNNCPDHPGASARRPDILIPLSLQIASDGTVRVIWFDHLAGFDQVCRLEAGQMVSNNGHGKPITFAEFATSVILASHGPNPLGLPDQ